MTKHWLYLKYVLRHKWFVFVAGRKLGVPLRRLILHDWTKFLPSEWLPHAEYHYSNTKPSPEVVAAYKIARTNHANRNDHHWQYWVLEFWDGDIQAQRMSDVAREEMLADWIASGRAPGRSDAKTWYTATRPPLHPETRQYIELMLKVVEPQLVKPVDMPWEKTT